MTKSIFAFLAALILVGLASQKASAQDVNARLNRLETIVNNYAIRIKKLEDYCGGGTGPSNEVVSSVKTDCTDTLKNAYNYQPSFDQIIGWAGQCRAQVSGTCQQVSSQFDQYCFNRLKGYYNYQMSADQITRLNQACQAITYSCY